MVSGTMCGGSIPFRCAALERPQRSGALFYKEDKNLDNFREWLSDNLRYFMLGGAILLIVACFGSLESMPVLKVRRVPIPGQGDQQTASQDNQGNVPSSPAKDGETDGKKDANPMEKGNAEITALITGYYKALGDKDIATLKTYVDNLAPSDESKITNAKDYIEGYEVRDVYVKKGLKDDSYVVYASFYYICKDIDTKVPALSQFYVYKDSEGQWKIDASAVEDTEISAYTDGLEADEDVKTLYSDIRKQLEDAQAGDSALTAFLDGLGQDTSDSSIVSDGTTLVVTEDCNVRAAASSDADIIGGLSAGEEVQKLGSEGDWIQVEYEGQTAYIYSGLLEEKTE